MVTVCLHISVFLVATVLPSVQIVCMLIYISFTLRNIKDPYDTRTCGMTYYLDVNKAQHRSYLWVGVGACMQNICACRMLSARVQALVSISCVDSARARFLFLGILTKFLHILRAVILCAHIPPFFCQLFQRVECSCFREIDDCSNGGSFVV
jgi:hypothetical protein